MEKHPKLVERLENYDKDRLVRMHVLNHVEREESINKSIQNEWKNNPEKKAALQTLVKHLPEEKQGSRHTTMSGAFCIQATRTAVYIGYPPDSLNANGRGKRNSLLPTKAGVRGRRVPMSADPARAKKYLSYSGQRTR